MDDVRLKFTYDPKANKYALPFHDGTTLEAARVRRNRNNGLFSKATVYKDGKRLTFGNIDLLDATARVKLAQAAASSNGVGPEFFIPHLDVLANTLDEEVPEQGSTTEQRKIRVTQLSSVTPESVEF